jgi:hypothetical protein
VSGTEMVEVLERKGGVKTRSTIALRAATLIWREGERVLNAGSELGEAHAPDASCFRAASSHCRVSSREELSAWKSWNVRSSNSGDDWMRNGRSVCSW